MGRRVVVTRSRVQASALGDRLRTLGAEVIELPVIRIEALHESDADAVLLDGVAERTHLVLTSVNGVDELFARLAARGADARALSPATIGLGKSPSVRTPSASPSTGLRADLVPERFVAEGISTRCPRPHPGRGAVARARGSPPQLMTACVSGVPR